MLTHLDSTVHYWSDVFPAVVLFGVGLAITVAPLTSAILGDVPSAQAGIASATNNAVARIAGLIAVAAVGAVVATHFATAVDAANLHAPADIITQAKEVPLQPTPPEPYQHDPVIRDALSKASVSAFHVGVESVAGLLLAGGVISLIGIRNPSKK
jgi:hypothetical protein